MRDYLAGGQNVSAIICNPEMREIQPVHAPAQAGTKYYDSLRDQIPKALILQLIEPTCKQPNDRIPVRGTCKIVVDYTPTQATPKSQFDTATLTIATYAEKVKPPGGIVQLKDRGKAPK